MHPIRKKEEIAMEIIFDNELANYMNKKGYAAVSLDILLPVGSEADEPEMITKFLTEKQYHADKDKAFKLFTEGDYPVLIMQPGYTLGNTLKLGLTSFLGAKDITVTGAELYALD